MDIVDEGLHIIVFKFHAEIEILTIGSIFGEVYICLAILWLGEINAPS